MNRLLTRMVLFFSCLIIVTGSVLGFVLYRSSMKLVEESIGAQARLIAENAGSRIDMETYAKLRVEDGETELYWELREALNGIREANGLKYLYTMGMSEDAGNLSYYYVVDGAPAEAAEGDYSPPGEMEANAYPGMKQAFQQEISVVGELTIDEEYGPTLTAYVPLHGPDGSMLGVIGADFDATEVYASMRKNTTLTIAVAAAAILSGILLVYVLARYLTSPLNRLTAQVAKVREGDMTVSIAVGRKDEIGHLALTFQELVTNTRTVITGIKTSSERLMHASEAMANHAQNTSEASRFIADSIRDATGGAEIQVNRAAGMTGAVDSMAVGMGRIMESASVVSDIADQTMQLGQQGNEVIGKAIGGMQQLYESTRSMNENMRELEQQSKVIREITGVMSDIASQTDLLALNAAIEAAHAGESGKGFAVVAEQVRKLANQSRAFSDQIAELTAGIQRQTQNVSVEMGASSEQAGEGLVLVQEAGLSFQSIVNGLQQVNVQLREVTAASQSIAAESQEVAASVEEMEQISRKAAQRFQRIAQSSGDQLESMNEVAASADGLRSMSGELTELNKRFVV